MRKVVYRGSNNDYDHHFAYQAKPLDYLFTGEPQSKYPVLHQGAFGSTVDSFNSKGLNSKQSLIRKHFW